MKAIILSLFLVWSAIGFTQKIKIDKTNTVFVDGEAKFILEGQNWGNTEILKNLNGERLAIFNTQDYYDSKHITQGNPKGRVVYFDVTFMNDDMDKCETPINGFKKTLAKEIISNELVKDGALNEKAVKQYVSIHGKRFSEEKNRSTTVIIVR
jgi:hypothetical protein